MTDSVRQWKRKIQVVVGKAGTGLLIENLRIKFEVAKTIESAPNVAVIKIYNLHPDNEAKVKNEFDELILNAGYGGGRVEYIPVDKQALQKEFDQVKAEWNAELARAKSLTQAGQYQESEVVRIAAQKKYEPRYDALRQQLDGPDATKVVIDDASMALLFRGNIKHVYRYREGNDYITEIEGGDGDKDFRKAVMNETLAAGTTNSQLVDRAVATFKSTGGTTKGHVQVNDRARIRGKVISGNTRDVLSDVAKESGANWSIQDGQLVIVGANAVMPGEAIVIRADTGMLGAPEINDKGIAVKCLLNPQLKVNGAIMLDNNGIKAKRVKAQSLATKREKEEAEPKSPVRLDPDGVYKVLKLTHKGDNRGPDWQSEIECIGLDQPIPSSRKQ